MKKIIITTIFILLMICGCSNKNVDINSIENTKEVFAMDTYMTLKIYGENSEKILSRAEEEILNLEKLFSVTNKSSDIHKINSNGGQQVRVSNYTAELIKNANEISDITNGALDISIYPIVKEWGFTTGNYKVPDKSTLENFLKNVNYKNIEIKNNYVSIPKGYSIDLGAVAKGYTGDKLVKIFSDNNIKSAIINLGGNVQTIGTKPNGEKWTVGIKNPIDTTQNICKIKVENKCVITSGNYERYFYGEDGKRYCHIIDPKTGMSADNGIISATVIGDSGVVCDGLSTALFALGTEKSINFLESRKDIDAILITKNMEIYITDKIENIVTVSDGYDYSVIKRS